MEWDKDLRVGLNKTDVSSFTNGSNLHNSIGLSGEITSAAPKSGQKKSTITTGANGQQYILYPFRWALQVMVTMAMVVSGFLMVGFSPIANTVAKIYGCSEVLVSI